ncbi:MAG: aryl-sulfate sulfotransferase [Pseudomonadota bacterium]|nr:aryl-sulfate sulfotransferase [Pseudomonadota bacterium]
MILLLACVTPDPDANPDKPSPDDTADTGGTVPLVLPQWVPDFAWSADAPEASAGGVTVVPLILSNGGGVVALDDAGAVIWAFPTTDAGLTRPPMRAHVSLDGTAVLFNHTAPAADRPAEVVRVPLDGSAPDTVHITGGHTDFVEYTPGGYATIGWDIRAFGDRKILGDTIVERDPDGNERVVWSVYDDFEPNLDETYAHLYPSDPAVEDWSHINGISYAAGEDAYFVSMTFNNGVAKIDRATGLMDWYVGDPDGGDFENPDRDRLLALPHSVARIEGGLLAFSRGNPGDPGACSEAVDLAVDETTREVRRAWSYAAPECLLVTFLGGAERLPGGNTVITWTTAGQIDQVTPDGRRAWTVNTALGAGIGFASWTPELATP